MSKTHIGIDPGLTGAIAWIRGDEYGVEDLPLVGKRIDADALHDYLTDYLAGERVVYIERSQAMPKQGSVSMFNYGVTYGLILACAEISRFPVHEVSPGVWKRSMGLVGRDKDDSRGLAHKLFPNCRDELKRKRDHGRSEALLIAEFGRRKDGAK